jgi:hypothetical protein
MVQLHGPTSVAQFLERNQFGKSLGSSLGVNRMWTERNDHAPKSECDADFFNIYSKRVVFKKIKK